MSPTWRNTGVQVVEASYENVPELTTLFTGRRPSDFTCPFPLQPLFMATLDGTAGAVLVEYNLASPE